MEKTMEKPYTVGIDIGGTNTVFGVVDARANILSHDSIKTKDYPDIHTYVNTLAERLMVLIDAAGGIDTIKGIGVGAPNGNYYTGQIEQAPNLPWKGIVPLAQLLKDRLGVPADVPPACDYLVWGHITAYKGVLELLEYLAARPQTFRVCIVGGCSDESLRRKIEAVRLPNVDCRFHAPSFEELRTYLDRSRFVLVPYHAASVLSSGILMDSLAFGAKVVGPDTGSFKDYAREPRLKVYTFRSFDDLAPLLAAHGDEPASMEAYRDFLTENDWAHFVRRLCRLLEGGRDSC